MKDYYRILEVHELASTEMIKSAYKMLSKKFHPDFNVSSNAMYLINEAYDILSDTKKRKAYDDLRLSQINQHFREKSDQMLKDYNGTTYLMIKLVMDRYMSAIQSKEYNKAYALLSDSTKLGLFKKDFMRWQSLIAEVHIIEEFQCALERIESAELIVFKIRVVEFNVLLNQYEEDYFEKILTFESGRWKVLLNQVNVDKVIHKYKRIVATTKGKERSIRRYFNVGDLKFHSGYVTKENFLNVASYESRRFRRYKRPFGFLAISFTENPKGLKKSQLINFVEKQIRSFDVFCFITDKIVLVLLPETNENQVISVKNKLSSNIEASFGDIIDVMVLREFSPNNHSVKHVINQIIKGCRTDGL